MKKKDLATLAGVSIYTMNKLTSDGNVTMEVIEKICTALNCKVDDILEFIKE
jgi:conserved domain protein